MCCGVTPPGVRTAIAQLGIPFSIRAPETRCTRIRSKRSNLVVNRLGGGGEADQFNVAVRLRHEDKPPIPIGVATGTTRAMPPGHDVGQSRTQLA